MGLTCHANANVPYTTSKNLISYFILTGIGTITYILLNTSYYCIWKYAFEAMQRIWRYAFEATQWIWSYAYEATQLIWSNSYEMQ